MSHDVVSSSSLLPSEQQAQPGAPGQTGSIETGAVNTQQTSVNDAMDIDKVEPNTVLTGTVTTMSHDVVSSSLLPSEQQAQPGTPGQTGSIETGAVNTQQTSVNDAMDVDKANVDKKWSKVTHELNDKNEIITRKSAVLSSWHTIGNQPTQEEEEDAMEVDEGPRKSRRRENNDDPKIYVETKMLEPSQKALIMDMDSDLYPKDFELEEGCFVETKDMFELRGNDEPVQDRGSNGSFSVRKRYPTILSIKNAGGERNWYGKNLALSLREANAIGEGTKTDIAKVPRQGTFKVQLNTQSQAPHIRLFVIDKKSDRPLSASIFASHLAITDEAVLTGFPSATEACCARMPEAGDLGPVSLGFSMDHDELKNDLPQAKSMQDMQDGRVDDDNLTPELALIASMYQQKKHTVIRIRCQFWGMHEDERMRREGNRFCWEADTRQRLQEIQKADPNNLAPEDEASVRFYRDLEGGTELNIYLLVGRRTLPDWLRVGRFSLGALRLSARWGNFWFYRNQLYVDGNQDDQFRGCIEAEKLAPIDWVVPRWMVRKWRFDKIKNEDGTTQYKNPIPTEWSSFWIPTQLPVPNETAFMAKLAIHQEEEQQIRNLEALLQTSETTHFHGRFHKVPGDNDLYAVEVFSNAREVMEERLIRQPPPGTRITVKVDMARPFEPVSKDMTEMNGSVTVDAFNQQADFTAVVSNPSRWNLAVQPEAQVPINISYIVSSLPLDRQMRAIEKIQTIDRDNKPPGLDVQRLVLGGDIRFSRPAEKLKPEELSKVRDFLAAVRPPMDESQLKAAQNSFESDTGSTVIVGPPGTGKTAVSIGIAFARIDLGHRVILTAAQNSVVQDTVEKFSSHLVRNKVLHEHEWVHLTGAHITPDAANRLRNQQILVDADQTERDNAVLDCVRDAGQRGANPEYLATFGYKLQQRILVWAQDKKHEMHGQAVEHSRTREELPRATGKDRQQLKLDIKEYEYNLGIYYLSNEVRVVFCTLSTLGHALHADTDVVWDEMIVDEAAHENMSGLAVPLGSLVGRINHVTWAGDHHQGSGMIISESANIASHWITRNLFQELVEDEEFQRDDDIAGSYSGVFTLNRCYRMTKELFEWSSVACYKGLLQEVPGMSETFPDLRLTLTAFFRQMQVNPDASVYNVGIDLTVDGFVSSKVPKQHTRYNPKEAEYVAWLALQMVTFSPPKGGRRIKGDDIYIITPYTGQVRQIQHELYNKCVPPPAKEGDDPKAAPPKLGPLVAELRNVRVISTAAVQGRQCPIAIYSSVLANGADTMDISHPLNFKFIAQKKNFNVSITRQQVCRVIVGALKLYCQVKADGQDAMQRTTKWFFNCCTDMLEKGQIISFEQISYFRTMGHVKSDIPGIRLKPKPKPTYGRGRGRGGRGGQGNRGGGGRGGQAGRGGRGGHGGIVRTNQF